MIKKQPSKERNTFMKKVINNIYVPLAAMCSLCLFAASCLSDDYDTKTVSTAAPSIRLYITANGMGDLNATRAAGELTGETEAGEDGEFINSLCVFVVDKTTSKIEYKFLADASHSSNFGTDVTAATNGNLLAHSISLTNSDGSFVDTHLTVGEKIIYAFANWENTDEGKGSGAWITLINKEADGSATIKENEDLNFYVTDPAGTIDFDNDGYIPMSGKTEATISKDLNYSSQLISVELVRLVSKVRISVKPESYSEEYSEVSISDLTFTGGANQVQLFSDITASGTATTYNESYSMKDMTQEGGTWGGTDSNPICTIANAAESDSNPDAIEIAKFYINETSNTSGFDISMTTSRTGIGTSQTDASADNDVSRVTEVQSVGRNCVYPIKLTLDVVNFSLNPTPYTAAIGITPDTRLYNITNDNSTSTYIITLADVTSALELNPVLTLSGTTIPSVEWKLTLNTTDDNLVIRQGTLGNYTYTARTATVAAANNTDGESASFYITHFTAIDYDEYQTMELYGEWYDDAGTTLKHTRKYTLKLKLDAEEPKLTGALAYLRGASGKSEAASVRHITRRLN